MELSDSKLNYLLAEDVCAPMGLTHETYGTLNKSGGVPGWHLPKQVFEWQVQAAEACSCEVVILVCTPAAGTLMILGSGSDSVEVASRQSGWDRIRTTLNLAGGDDSITLRLKHELGQEKNAQAQLFGLKIITASFLPVYERQRTEWRTAHDDGTRTRASA